MLTTTDFKKGVRFLLNREPYMILDVVVQTPSGRGGATLVKVKARNLLDGRFVTETFKAGEKFEEPDISYVQVQYLYQEGEKAVFMDQEHFEQHEIPLAAIGAQAKYLSEDLKIRIMFFNGKPTNVDLPAHVELVVSSVEPGTRGDTATGVVMTNATLENGMAIKVPLGIKEGERILVDTAEDAFYRRAETKQF